MLRGFAERGKNSAVRTAAREERLPTTTSAEIKQQWYTHTGVFTSALSSAWAFTEHAGLTLCLLIRCTFRFGTFNYFRHATLWNVCVLQGLLLQDLIWKQVKSSKTSKHLSYLSNVVVPQSNLQLKKLLKEQMLDGRVHAFNHIKVRWMLQKALVLLVLSSVCNLKIWWLSRSSVSFRTKVKFHIINLCLLSVSSAFICSNGEMWLLKLMNLKFPTCGTNNKLSYFRIILMLLLDIFYCLLGVRVCNRPLALTRQILFNKSLKACERWEKTQMISYRFSINTNFVMVLV